MVTHVEFWPGPNLFVDDHLIAESQGLRRTTHQPAKLPAPVLRRGAGWHLQPQWFLEVKRHPVTGQFQAWYNVKKPDGKPYLCYAYAESGDGVAWQLPDLGLVEVDGSRHNNLIDAPMGHFGLFLVDEGLGCPDPARRFKMAYYTAGPEPSKSGMCIAFSPDGKHFSEYAGNPVIRAGVNEVPFAEPGYGNVISDIIDGCWDPRQGQYLLGCKIEQSGYPGTPHHHAAGWRRCVGMSTSRDFVTWAKPQVIVTPHPDHGLEEFYGFKPTVRGNLYLGFLRVLRDDLPATPGGAVEGIGWTELLTSRDGSQWTRHPEPFIDRDPRPGTWDHAMAWYADSVTVGDQEYIYYGGYSAGHKVGHREVGLATLRKNGFVSRDAGRAGGRLRTPPALLPHACGLTVNAVVRGDLRVRLADAAGHALPDYDWEVCTPVHGDSGSHPVRWRGVDGLPTDRPVSLEFALSDADLYGFDLAPPALGHGQ